MNATQTVAPSIKPKPASAAVRATKIDRKKALETWCLENPEGTIEGARKALREKFNGIAMGTAVISHTLNLYKKRWEEQRKKALSSGAPLAPPSLEVVQDEPASIQKQIAFWAQQMRASGVKLIEIVADGKVRVEFEG